MCKHSYLKMVSAVLVLLMGISVSSSAAVAPKFLGKWSHTWSWNNPERGPQPVTVTFDIKEGGQAMYSETAARSWGVASTWKLVGNVITVTAKQKVDGVRFQWKLVWDGTQLCFQASDSDRARRSFWGEPDCFQREESEQRPAPAVTPPPVTPTPAPTPAQHPLDPRFFGLWESKKKTDSPGCFGVSTYEVRDDGTYTYLVQKICNGLPVPIFGSTTELRTDGTWEVVSEGRAAFHNPTSMVEPITYLILRSGQLCWENHRGCFKKKR